MLSDSDLDDEDNNQSNICLPSILNSDDNHDSKTNSFKCDEYTKSKNLTSLTKYSNGSHDNARNKKIHRPIATSNIAPGFEENGAIVFGNISPPRDAMNEYLHENMRNLENGSYLITSSGHSLDTNSSGLNSYCNGFSMQPLNDDQFLISSDDENQVLVWQHHDNTAMNYDCIHTHNHNEQNHVLAAAPPNHNNLLVNQVSDDFIDIDMLPQAHSITQSDIETEEEMLDKLDDKHSVNMKEKHYNNNPSSNINKKPLMNDFWNNLNRRLSNDSAASSLQLESRGDSHSSRNSPYNGRREYRLPFPQEDQNHPYSNTEAQYFSHPLCQTAGHSLQNQEDAEDADSESSDTNPVVQPAASSSSNWYRQREVVTLHRSSAILSDISNDVFNSIQSKRVLNNQSHLPHQQNVHLSGRNILRRSEASTQANKSREEAYPLSPSVRNRYHLSGLNRLTPCASTGHLLDLEVTNNEPSILMEESHPSKSLDLDKKHNSDKTVVRPANSVDQLTENFVEPSRCPLPRQSPSCNGYVVPKPLYVSSCLAESDRFQWSHGVPSQALIDEYSAMIWSDLQATLSQRAQRLPSSYASVAVINMLRALRLSHHAVIPILISSLNARQNVVRSDSSGRVQGHCNLPQYLISRSQQGISGHRLVSMVNQALTDLVVGRFFQTGSDLNISISGFLMSWIRLGAVPILTINTQMGLPDMVPDVAWQHQMVYGVRPEGICLSNPNQTVPESLIEQQLNSSSTLLIRQCDILANWSPNSDVTQLCRQTDPRWNLMNVLGQVVCTVRESQHENFPGFKPDWAHHIRIPCIHKPGISLFVAANNRKAVSQLLSAPELGVAHVEAGISLNYESDHSSSQFSTSLLPPQSSPSESTDSSSNSAGSAVSSLHLSAPPSRSQQSSILQPLLNVPGGGGAHHSDVPEADLVEPSTPSSSDFLIHGLETQSSLTTAPSTSLSTGEVVTDLPFGFLTRSVSHAVPAQHSACTDSGDVTVSHSCPTNSAAATTDCPTAATNCGGSGAHPVDAPQPTQSAHPHQAMVVDSSCHYSFAVSNSDSVNGSATRESNNAPDRFSESVIPNRNNLDVISLSPSSHQSSSSAGMNALPVNGLAVSRADSTNRSHGSSTVAQPR